MCPTHITYGPRAGHVQQQVTQFCALRSAIFNCIFTHSTKTICLNEIHEIRRTKV